MSVKILAVDDEDMARDYLSKILKDKGYEVEEVESFAKTREAIESGDYDIILLDVVLPDGYGPDLLKDIHHHPTPPQIILVTSRGNIDMAVDALHDGAVDFITKPINLERLERALQRASQLVIMRREIDHYRSQYYKDDNEIIGNSPKLKYALQMAQRAAEACVDVLIIGEHGTGKELVAKAIGRMSPRKGKPFISVDMPNISANLFESELFGHEKNAFTHAMEKHIGLIEVADGGILFLDEIAALPYNLQPKLLRVLQEREFRRVGGTKQHKVDVQIIAATNKPLQEWINEGKFHPDLYYRLNVFTIHVPPLRERKEDIPELAAYFLHKFNTKFGSNIHQFSQRALEAMNAYDWPGNIRELEHAIERAVILCDEETIDLRHLPKEVYPQLLHE
jgi:two-component system NtrC family response regulator